MSAGMLSCAIRALAAPLAAALFAVPLCGVGHAAQASPVYGINLGLFGDTGADQVVDDPATQAIFRGLGVPFVRVPMREGLTDARLVTAMRAVSAIGAAPVIIM